MILTLGRHFKTVFAGKFSTLFLATLCIYTDEDTIEDTIEYNIEYIIEDTIYYTIEDTFEDNFEDTIDDIIEDNFRTLLSAPLRT